MRGFLRALGRAALVVSIGASLAVALAAPRTRTKAAAPLPPISSLSADELPVAIELILRRSGLPRSAFAIDVRPVDRDDAPPLIALNADRPYLLASTTKLVTTMAALDLLGPNHHWITIAQSTGVLKDGRLTGDLVLTGGPVGLTLNELSRWFAKMRAQGLRSVAGNIVLDDFTLLHERDPKQVSTTEEESEASLLPAAPSANARLYNEGKLAVAVKPGDGPRAVVTVSPKPANVLVVNDVFMGDGGCSAWARWKTADEIESGPPLQLWVRGRWKPGCPAASIGWVNAPQDMRVAADAPAAKGVRTAGKAGKAAATSAPVAIGSTRLVAERWASAGGGLGGRVVELDPKAPRPRFTAWTSELSTPLAEVVREMNKTSNNDAARSIMLSFAQGWTVPVSLIDRRPLVVAQERVRRWLRDKGLADGDITVDVGSGQSRAERGKAQAMVQLLRSTWRSASLPTLLESLPIAGVDGTLARRMTTGPARGQAHLKTGTLSDTRALAGYVRARSGKVYAMSMMVTDPAAAGATASLDAVVEWIASSG